MSQDFNLDDNDECKEGAAWLATYADLVTLLFAFFVLLFAMASVSEDKFEQLKQSLSKSIGNQEVPEAGTRVGLSMKDVESEATPDAVDELGGMIQKQQEEEMISEVKEFIMFNKLGGKVSAENNDKGVVITLSDMLMFTVGKAEIKQSGKETLGKLAGILKQFNYNVRIVGHTDNIPVGKGNIYKSNWELSSARACDIVELLINKGIDPIYLTAAGRGSVEPIASNDTPEGRTRNRRVEIIYERSTVSPDQIEKQKIENETK